MNALMTDPEKMKQLCLDQVNWITDSDKDGDGLLNWEEFQGYLRLTVEKGREQGYAVADIPDDIVLSTFEAYKRAEGSDVGVSPTTLQESTGQIAAAMKASGYV